MKKQAAAIAMTLVFCVVLHSCKIASLPSGTENINGPAAPDSADTRPVYFADDNLRDAININKLGKPAGYIPTKGELTGIRTLSLSNRGITSLDGIENCVNLYSFYAEENSIIDITPLMNIGNLTNLNLSHNRISDLTPFKNAQLPDMQRLWLGYNNIESLDGLQNMPKLDALYLEHNKIRDISPILSHTNLLHLNISVNDVCDISGLSAFTSLIVVTISGNSRLADISSLYAALGMLEFYADSCAIENVGAAAGWTKLKAVRLSYNKISDITPLVLCYVSGALSPPGYIELRGNPLGYKALNSDIPAFQTAGLAVYY